MNSEWKIYNENGEEILENGIFINYNYKSASQVLEFSIENGSFAQYNKVNISDILSINLAFSNDVFQLATILRELENLKKEANKIRILTPEKNYLNFTLKNFSYSKQADKGLIIFSLEFVEIREVNRQYSNSALNSSNIKNATHSSVIQRGRVEAETLNQDDHRELWQKIENSS